MAIDTKSTVLVTGASGSLGKQLLYELTTQGYRPIAQVRDNSKTDYIDSLGLEKRVADIRNKPQLAELVKGVDAIIHTVALVDFRQDRLTQFTGVNTFGATDLYLAARAAGVKRFVHVSSVAAVGAVLRTNGPGLSHPNSLANEEHEFNLRHLQIPYIMTKRAAEEELLKLAAQPGPELVIVNPSIMVAPSRTGDDRGKATKRFNQPILPGMHNWMNLVDIRDVAPAIVAAMVKGRPGERYILGGDNITERDLILHVSAQLKIAPHIWSIPRGLVDFVGWFAGRYHHFRSKFGSGHKVSFYPDIVKMLDYDWAYSSQKAKTELGFRSRSLFITLKDLLTNDFRGTYLKP
ncbi:MAG: NAD-dependent epimerase/dehydratase family protein [bacterium]|nr:NAD-dependent epimerase/dehydratase family protein [bacterium]